MPVKNIAKNVFLILAGSAIYTIGLNGILIPKEFLNGGTTGITLILVYLFPFLPFGLVYVLTNLPLMVLGWFTVSRRFIYYTIAGVVGFSMVAQFLPVPMILVDDPILAALLAGVICGTGAGVILRSQGSAGGIDILAVYLFKKYSLKMGMTSFLINVVVLTIGAFYFSLEMALYTMIFIFTQSKLIDVVIAGFNRRKSVIIISDKSEEITRAIIDHFHHGVTYLEGTGAFSGKSKKVVFSIITMTELARLKEIAFRIDPNLFMVVNDTVDVIGSTIGKPKVY